MKIKKLIQNEKGSGTIIIMVCMVLGAIFFSFLFFDFSNVFINKRVTQTGADAAAIAAAQEANQHMKEYLQEETQDKLDRLGDEWENAVDISIDEFIPMIENRLHKPMPSDIKAWLTNHSIDVKAETAMKFFFKDNEVRDLACERIDKEWPNIKDAAEDYAQKNQNDKVTDITFIEDDFRIYVKTERKGKYTTVPDGSIPAITSDSSARIGEPKGYEGDMYCS